MMDTDTGHLNLLKQGVEVWNAWRAQNPSVAPNLSRAVLRGADLSHANLRDADLSRANLQGTSFISADLRSADLSNAHLSGANFDHAVLIEANLRDAVLGNPEILASDFWHIYRYPGDTLRGVIWAPLWANQSGRVGDYVRYDIPDEEFETWRNHIMGTSLENYRPANLSYADLEDASLEKAICDRVTFRHARLVGTNLRGSRLIGADFSSADLTRANVMDASLGGAVISRTALKGTRRRPAVSWADAQEGAFEGSVEIYTDGFHEFLTGRIADAHGDFHVTFIHGTFAQDADWVDPKGALARQLATEARHSDLTRAVHPYAFQWSGRNTFHARRQAVEELRAHLRTVIAEHPTGIHCAVAHSHGGTILLHALRDGEIAERMARVVCMSTPFIRIVPNADAWTTAFSVGVKSLEAIILVAGALWLTTLAQRYAVTAAHPGLVALVVELALILAFVAVNRTTDAALRRWQKHSEVIAGMSGHPQLRLDQAVFIRTAADEAAFGIGLGATGAWLFERAAIAVTVVADLVRWFLLWPVTRARIGWPMFIVVMMSLVVLLIALFVLLLPSSPLLYIAYAVIGVAGLCVLPDLVLLPFVVLLSVCYIPFGYELALCTPFLRATVEAAPSGIWRVFQFPSLRLLPLLKMQHSYIYESSSMRLFIARWIVAGEFISKHEWREA